MEYPIFNIPYKEAYTSSIEFKTEIQEKLKGHEQRYPVWTYPKRTFVLKFEKSYKTRKLLEEFFVQVMGQAGKFRFVWDVEKGGNGKTYVCNFDSDSLSQDIMDFGYSECELKFSCIDDSSVQNVAELDFCYNAEYRTALNFYTVVDKIFTARNERMSYWDAPLKTWELKFEKTPDVRKRLEEFFIAKRGMFRAFRWKWKKEFGGDDQYYNVRFDTDSLDVNIDAFGYGTIEVQLKEVLSSQVNISQTGRDEIIPRRLLKIEIEGGSIYILDNETLNVMHYNGEEYLGAPLAFDGITKDDNSSVSKLKITLSNVGLAISGIVAQRGDVITDSPAVLTLVFLDLNNNSIIPSLTQVLFAGKCNNLELDCENASMEIETALGGYEVKAPIMKFRTTCQVRRFKDCRCGYTGAETACDRTFARCKELGNETNFRGFPQMYSELVIKV